MPIAEFQTKYYWPQDEVDSSETGDSKVTSASWGKQAGKTLLEMVERGDAEGGGRLEKPLVTRS